MKKALKYILPLVLLGAAFVGGVVVGENHAFKRYFSPKEPQEREAFRGRMLDQMERKLELSKEQRDSVDSILKEGGERVRSVRKEFDPRFEEIHAAMQEKINEVLTPAQQERFKKHKSRIMRWRKGKHRKGGRHGTGRMPRMGRSQTLGNLPPPEGPPAPGGSSTLEESPTQGEPLALDKP